MYRYLILLLLITSACKDEPNYRLKEPFGNSTASAADDNEDDRQEYVVIPKKFLNSDRIKEQNRKNEAIQKKLKEAWKFNPNEKR